MKLKKRAVVDAVLILLAILATSVVGIDFLSIEKDTEEVRSSKYTEIAISEDNYEETSLSLVMVGDVLIHDAVYVDARKGNSYDFTKMFTNVKSVISKYDLAYYNQETILGGTEIGLSTYPLFNSPQQVGDAMLDMGFNLVSLATNHSLDRGKVGALKSRQYWDKQKDVLAAGMYSSQEQRDTPVIMEKNGITYTLLSYTTLTNGLIRPSDSPYIVNIYNEEEVKEDIEKVRDKVDVVMVAMHWGAEYTHVPVQEELEIAEYLASLDVDIVIGCHPHVIQPIDFIDDTLVIYSLGNFISAQRGVEKLTGLMASVTIKKTTVNGVSTITLENPGAELVYTDSTYNPRANFKLYPYSKLNNSILPGYQSYCDKYMNIITSMNDSIERIGC